MKRNVYHCNFRDWTGDRSLATLGSNAGSRVLPFQSWRRFKEAFAPELVDKALSETSGAVRHIVDPFGGSGTTALAAQFLGVRPTTIEVNPFLADLIKAKLARYNFETAARAFSEVVGTAWRSRPQKESNFDGAPATFVEPGVDGRYVFGKGIARRILQYRNAISSVPDPVIRRLFRVILGSVVVPVSNIIVSGKGRRYRSQWQLHQSAPPDVDRLFQDGVMGALHDLRRFDARRCRDFSVIQGDAREVLSLADSCDLVVFSPPYPNSFDYTDVYNVELWTLGYLSGKSCDRELRCSTLRSHVQVARDMQFGSLVSPSLHKAYEELCDVRTELWNRHIPEMVAAYSADMYLVLGHLAKQLRVGGRVYMIVGDSRYAGVNVPVASILAELAESMPYRVQSVEACRSMRSSPQQGGRHELPESLVVLEKRH